MSDLKTFVFGNAADSVGPLALGVGVDLESARKDAIARMMLRHPWLNRPDFASTPPERLLFDRLERQSAFVVSRIRGGYPTNEEMGHEYMSYDSYAMAQALTSDSLVHKFLEKAGDRDMNTFRAVEAQFVGRCRSNGADPRLVDWCEVVKSFPEEVISTDADSAQRPALAEPASKASRRPAPIAAVETEVDAGRRIDPDVLTVLASSTVDGLNVRLPDARLARDLYERVNEVLVALGGKWVGRKVMAHVFVEDPRPVLEVAIGTGTFVKPQDFGYFPTQPNEVRRVIDLADLRPGMKGLEPSAGQGAIAIEMAKILGFDNVAVVELLQSNAQKLLEAGFSAVNRVDFLSIEPVPIYDRIIMNPPFSGLADIAHIQHATRFLKPDGRLVAISSPSWTFNAARKAKEFRDFVEECSGEVEEVAAGAFKDAGTNVATRIITLDAENFPWNREAAPVERMRA